MKIAASAHVAARTSASCRGRSMDKNGGKAAVGAQTIVTEESEATQSAQRYLFSAKRQAISLAGQSTHGSHPHAVEVLPIFVLLCVVSGFLPIIAPA
jgi:hypothetical protein